MGHVPGAAEEEGEAVSRGKTPSLPKMLYATQNHAYGSLKALAEDELTGTMVGIYTLTDMQKLDLGTPTLVPIKPKQGRKK